MKGDEVESGRKEGTYKLVSSCGDGGWITSETK